MKEKEKEKVIELREQDSSSVGMCARVSVWIRTLLKDWDTFLKVDTYGNI